MASECCDHSTKGAALSIELEPSAPSEIAKTSPRSQQQISASSETVAQNTIYMRASAPEPLVRKSPSIVKISADMAWDKNYEDVTLMSNTYK
jgi:hypothetical protein